MRLHGKFTPYLFLLLPVAVFASVVIIPVVSTIWFGLIEWNGITEPQFIGLSNFRRLLSDRVLRDVMVNTLQYAATATVFQLGLGMLLAILLQEVKKGQNLLRMLLFTPTVISSMAMSQAFRQLLNMSPDGVINAILGVVGLGDWRTAWLSDPNINIFIVAIVDSFRFAGLYMVIFHAAFTSINSEVLEAASIDGANKVQTLFRVKLPMIRAIIVNCLILVSIGTFRAFDGPMILTGGGPGHSSEVISLYMFRTAFGALDYRYAGAISVLIVVMSILIYTLISRLTRVKEH